MMRTSHPITAAEFTRAVGRPPILDDLQRANCKLAGYVGHWGCGWCEHDLPVWRCMTCAREAVQKGTARG